MISRIRHIRLIPRFARWLTATRRRKIVSVTLSVIILFTSLGYFFLPTLKNQSDICKTQMQTLDEKILAVTDFEKVETKTNSVSGNYLTYTIINSSKNLAFELKDSEGNKHNFTLNINDNYLTKQEKYKDSLKNIFKLNESDDPVITYTIEASADLILDASTGGYLAVRYQKTGEEFALFRTPQGIDKKSQRIDYSFELDGNILSLKPNRDWQLGCAKYPITLHSQITASAWDEALVKVGENCDQPGCEADGDVLQIRPAGWNWGLSERKENVIIRIAKLSEEKRSEYSSRTEQPPEEDDIDEDAVVKDIPDEVKPKIFEQGDLVRYGIDYTKLANPEQLTDIRNPQKESPVIDAINKLDIIRKKNDPRLSVIPEKNMLAYKDFVQIQDNLRNKKGFLEKIIPPANAAGTIVKSIGTAAGRDYSDIASWESAQQGDLVAAQEIHQGVVYNDSEFDITSSITIDGSITNSSYYMHLTVAPGDRHRGKASTGAKIDCQNVTGGIGIQDPYTRVEWMEITRCGGANGRSNIALQDATDILVQNVILYKNSNSASNSGVRCASSGTASGTIRNSIIYDGQWQGVRGTATTCTLNIENVTIWGAGKGIYEDTATFTLKNVIAMNNSSADFDVDNGSLTNLLCEDNDADCNAGIVTTCTNCLYNKSTSTQFVSTTSGAENLHLKAGSDAIDAGNTISGFQTDIDDETRPFGTSWDIGADEYSPTDPILYHKYDEGYGTVANDQSANANNGSISGATWQTEDLCVSGKCLKYDGDNDVTTVTNSNSIDFDLGLSAAVTFQGWIRTNSDGELSTGAIFNKGADTRMRIENEGSDGLADLTASLALSSNNATVTVTNGITLNRWHHVVMAYTDDADDEITVYIDSRIRGTSTNGSGSPTSNDTANLEIGGTSTTNFHGFIDEFKVYDYERTASEIKTDYLKLAGPHGSSAAFGDSDSYLSDGLVGYWKIDEPSGTSVADSSGNSNTGTATDANSGNGDGNTPPSVTGGRFNYARDFDGVDDYVNVSDFFYSDTLSVCAWIRGDTLDANARSIVVKRNDSGVTGGTNEWALTVESQTVRFTSWQDNSTTSLLVTSSSTLSTNTWYQVCGVQEGNGRTGRVFVNGVQDGNVTQTAAMQNGPALVQMGARTANNDNRYWDGKIDEVRIYNRALTPSEVLQLYNWGPPPVGHWKLDEPSAGTSAVTRNDSSGNNNNLTDNNTTPSGIGKFGNAALFETSNNERLTITAGSQTGLDITGNITLSAWINMETTANTMDIMRRNDAGPTNGYRMRWNSNGYVECTLASGGSTVNSRSSRTLSTGTWYFISCSYDGSNQRLYVNGVLEDTDAYALGIGTNSSTFGISDGNYFDGRIDDARLYNYARSPGQIIEDMNAGHPNPGSPIGSPVAHWKFNEGALNTCSGGINDFCDTTPNANDLAYSGTSGGITNSGKFGKAFDGDGTRWASRADDDDFDFAATEDFSVSMWFKSDSANNPGAIEYLLNKSRDSTTQNAGYAVYTNTQGFICFAIDDDTTWDPDVSVCSTADFYDNTWHHITAIRNVTDDNLYLFIDAQQRGSSNDTTTASLANVRTLFLGDRQGVNAGADGEDEFTGDFDEAKIFRFALTNDQVKVLYNQTSGASVGSISTDTSGNPDWSSSREYCPPGETTACNSPIGEWKLDDNSGTTASDSSTNGNNASLNFGSTWAVGKIGPGVSLDATNDDINFGDPASGLFDFGATDSFSASFWMKISSNAINHTPFLKGGAPGWRFRTRTSDNTIFFQIRDGLTSGQANSDDAIQPVTDGNWHHIVGVRDVTSDTVKLYVDGVLHQSATDGTTTGFENTNPLLSGATAVGDPVDGLVDNFRLYNYARTPAQVAWEYNRGGPIGWWKFNECSGITANDNSAKGGNGTITEPGGGSNVGVGTCNGSAGTMWADGATGKRNASLEFDGTDDYTQVSDSLNLRFNSSSQDFSIFTWIKRAASGVNHYIISKEDADNDGWRMLITSSNTVQCSVNSLDVTSSTTITDTNWHYIGCTIDRDGNGQVYIDGKTDGSAVAISSTSMATTSNIRIATRSYTSTNYFNGQIDELKLFGYVLTPQQIRDVYNSGTLFFGPNEGAP